MKQFGKPVGSGPDLFNMVVIAVVVAFMLTLAAQVSATPNAGPFEKRSVPAISCDRQPLPADTRMERRTAPRHGDAQPCSKGVNPLRTMAGWVLSAR